jgi:hypothetical protein
MFLMYVDESGDCGLVNSPSRYFALTGLVVHELRWRSYLDEMIAFRQDMRKRFGLKLREEIHAAGMISRPGDLVRIPRNDRLTILRRFADLLASLSDLNVINVAVNKASKTQDYDVFEKAWLALIQRFENTLSFRNFRGPANADECGMIFPDHTDDKKLTLLARRMRKYNPIPNKPEYGSGFRNKPLTRIIEDPSFRRSDHSYFIQAADLAAFLLYQYLLPNAYIRRVGARHYLRRLDPILCKHASPTDPLGIVNL